MEFPDLGKHCSESSCKQLDFLPMKCDSCQKIFCKDHITYKSHNCEYSFQKDVQVPVCPLCNQPVPVARGEPPDIKMSQHIDADCQSDPAKKKRKAYSNKCSLKGCKQRELVPVVCGNCRLNFCLKHRHQTDHQCKGFQGSGRSISLAGASAMKRAESSNSKAQQHKARDIRKPEPKQTTLFNDHRGSRDRGGRSQPVNSAYTLQAGMSEDEAMSRALQMSLADLQPDSQTQKPTSPPQSLTPQEQEDLALAQAIAESEEEERRQRQRQRQQNQQKDSTCSVA